MEENRKIFTKKADQIYITMIMYLVFGLIYVAVRGTAISGTLKIVYQDPVVYIVFIFLLYAVLRLMAYWIQKPRVEICTDRLIIKHEYNERVCRFSEIRAVKIVHWRSRYTKERIRYVMISLKEKRRSVKLKLSNYENERVLADELLLIETKVKEM